MKFLVIIRPLQSGLLSIADFNIEFDISNIELSGNKIQQIKLKAQNLCKTLRSTKKGYKLEEQSVQYFGHTVTVQTDGIH